MHCRPDGLIGMLYLSKFGCWKTCTLYISLVITYGNWNKTSGYVKKWNFFWAPGTHNYRSGGVISLCVYDVAGKMVKAFLNMLARGTFQILASNYKINYWVFLSVCLSVSLFSICQAKNVRPFFPIASNGWIANLLKVS